VIVQEGSDVKTGTCIRKIDQLSDESLQEIARKAVNEAVSMLGAKSLKSGDYPVVLRHDVATSLLEVFHTVFSAEQVQKGLSYYQGRIGEDIASPLITIIDDPGSETAAFQTPFDADGVPTYKKTLIEQGKLTTFLHNLKTAEKEAVSSTGNASRSSYKSGIEIAPSNLFIANGENSFEDLLKKVGNGVLITDVQGTHSGTNDVSGDFSLAADGYWIENGEMVRPIHQITISGNYFHLLNQVEALANDMEFSLPSKNGSFASPSWFVPSLAVAGE
jgi:PmbA protein